MEHPSIVLMQQWGASDLYLVNIVYDSAGGQQTVACLAIPRGDHIQATIL